MLTFEQIKELLELVGRHQLEGLELERSGFRLSIAGRSEAPPAAPAAPAVAAAAPSAALAAPPAGPAAGATASSPAARESDARDGDHVVRSPIVGTYYQAPSPDAEPFVRVGDRVRKGQVLCIIEAMKLMNEIESDTAGVVLEIHPGNGQPVEFGEQLFTIRPG